MQLDPRARRSIGGAAGVRPAVWLLAGACFVAALGTGVLAARSHRESARAPVPTEAFAAPPSERVADGASAGNRNAVEQPPTPSESPLTADGAPMLAGEPSRPAGKAPAGAMTRADAPGDSQLAAEIGVLETEAARVAQARGLGGAVPAARSRDHAEADAERVQLSDALLVDYFMQDAYRGTEFPIGYPAEERTRAAAESRVRGLTPELRRDTLEVILQSESQAEPAVPNFAPPESGFVWEGALR